MLRQPAQAMLIDLDGVLRRWEPLDAVEARGYVELDIAVRIGPLKIEDGALQGIGSIVVEDRERVMRCGRSGKEAQRNARGESSSHGIFPLCAAANRRGST